MRLAIVVGHNSESQGAVRTDSGETEFRFNSRIAELVETFSRLYQDFEVRTFYRQAGGGYTREIRRVYAETDAWDADVTCELHFNGAADPRASGTETLTSGTPTSMRVALEVNNAMVAALGLRDRGVKTRRSGRGSGSLMTGDAPAILVEPFFGSSPSDCKVMTSAGEEALARAIVRGVAKAKELLPRKTLEGSRTKTATQKQRRAKKLTAASSATGVLSTILTDAPALQNAIGMGQAIEGVLPWVAGFGFAIAVGAMVYDHWQSDVIDEAREDDFAKEIR